MHAPRGLEKQFTETWEITLGWLFLFLNEALLIFKHGLMLALHAVHLSEDQVSHMLLKTSERKQWEPDDRKELPVVTSPLQVLVTHCSYCVLH